MIKPTLNPIDKAISVISPKLALERVKARALLFSYDEGVRSNNRYRNTASAYQNTTSTSTLKLRDRTQIMWEARDLVDNSSLIKSILFRIALYVCAKVRYQARTGDEVVDQQIEAVWENFTQNCDITGRNTFRKLCQLAIVGMLRDGDFGFIVVNDANGIKLASIESDRIGSPYESLAGEGYIQGIFIDAIGRPVRYRIFDRSREGAYLTYRDYEATSFIHILDPLRADGYRGVSGLDASIASGTARDLYELLQNEKVATKWQTAQAGIVKRSGGEAGWDTTTTTDGKRLEKIEAGTINYLEANEDIIPFGVTRPSVTFTGFIQTLVREVCMSLGVPYGFFYDMSALGGATARLESAQAQRAFEHYQNVLEDKFLNRIKNIVIARGITDGLIPNVPKWNNGIWQYGAHPTVDVGRESQANIAEMQVGLKTAADIYGEQGKDWQEEQEQLAKEKANMKALAVKYGLDEGVLDPQLKDGKDEPKPEPAQQGKPEEKKLSRIDVPPIKNRLIAQLVEKNYGVEQATKIAHRASVNAGNINEDGTPTAKGIERGNMSPAERAIDRAIRYAKKKRKAEQYQYDPLTNRATIRKEEKLSRPEHRYDPVTDATGLKKKRCWKGYEPVAGKTPYSDGSCKKMGRGRPRKSEVPNADHITDPVKKHRYLATIMRKRARRIMRSIYGNEINGKHIDHIDHNPLNNDLSNLRIRDAIENKADNKRKNVPYKKKENQ
jgi:lambda family phage portal protein